MSSSLQHSLEHSFTAYARHTAILAGSSAVSYEQLSHTAANIAAGLAQQEIPALTFIGVTATSRIDYIYAFTGILKGRYVYVPIDPRLPVLRVQQMVRKLKIRHLLADHTALDTIYQDRSAFSEVCFHELEALKTNVVPAIPNPAFSEDDPAYVYFTSGSTGEAKAVLGRNGSLQHFIQWELKNFHIDHTVRASQFVHPGFDAWMRDILVPLFAGGTICIYPAIDSGVYEQELTAWLNDTRIGLIHCVPSFFKLVNHGRLQSSDYPALQYVLLSGEHMAPQYLENWYRLFGKRIQLVNLYGTTETTLIRTWYPIQPEDVQRPRIPAGQPIADTEILLLDGQGQACEAGATGEIYISTPYMTYGYYSDEQQQQERFLPHPFNTGKPWAYRTGDLGRWLPDGNLDILGRKDKQVKIRGIRVNLQEIENAILRHPDIKEVVVTAPETAPGEQSLQAYYVPGRELLPESLRTFLQSVLPPYLVPGSLMPLSHFPLLPNGKINMNALPVPEWSIPQEQGIPGNHLEEVLRKIWAELLHLSPEKINTDINFFQLGGNSIQVLQFLSRALEMTGYRIPLEKFLRMPTIRACAGMMAPGTLNGEDTLTPAPAKSGYVLTENQEHIFYDCYKHPSSTAYNMISIVDIVGEISAGEITTLLQQLIARHEMFRTSFHIGDNGSAYQVVHPEVAFAVVEEQVEEDQLQQVIRACIKPFELDKAPLIRAFMIRAGKDKSVLLLDIHHLLTDAVSMRIMEKELKQIYRGVPLAPLTLHYKDYAEWLHQPAQQQLLQEQQRYWLRQYQALPAPLTLPMDEERPAVKSYEGAIYRFECDAVFAEKLNSFARAEQVTLFTLLLTCYYILLQKLGDTSDIVVGIPAARRSHPATGSMMGLFVGELALRISSGPDQDFRTFLHVVHTTLIDAYKHQDFQYRQLLQQLDLPPAAPRNPLFDVWFAFQQVDQSEVVLSEKLKFVKHINNNTVALFDLLLRGYEIDGQIQFRFEYYRKIFREERMAQFAGYYLDILDQVLANDRVSLRQIRLQGQENMV